MSRDRNIMKINNEIQTLKYELRYLREKYSDIDMDSSDPEFDIWTHPDNDYAHAIAEYSGIVEAIAEMEILLKEL